MGLIYSPMLKRGENKSAILHLRENFNFIHLQLPSNELLDQSKTNHLLPSPTNVNTPMISLQIPISQIHKLLVKSQKNWNSTFITTLVNIARIYAIPIFSREILLSFSIVGFKNMKIGDHGVNQQL